MCPDKRDGGRLMAVTVQTDATFAAGSPEVLFEGIIFSEPQSETTILPQTVSSF